jgi:putative peptidoglycan lipid II flippase
VVLFAVRQKFFVFDRAFVTSLAKFALAGVVLAAALWLASRWASSALATQASLRDETALGILIVVGAAVYGGSVLLLFGRRWLVGLIRP